MTHATRIGELDRLAGLGPEVREVFRGLLADLPVVYGLEVSDLADATNVIKASLPAKMRLVDAWVVMKGAGTAGGTVAVTDGTNVIVTAIVVAAAGDKDIVRAAEIDDVYHVLEEGAAIEVDTVSTGGDFAGAFVYVVLQRVT
jgi:hypothetical protein